MKNLLVLSLMIILVSSCNKNNKVRTKAIDFIPENASFVLKLDNKNIFDSNINANSLIDITDINESSSFELVMSQLEYLNTNREIIIAFDTNDTSYLITRYNDSILIKDSVNIKDINVSKYKKHTIKKTKIVGDTLFNTVIDSFFVASNNKKSIKHVIDNQTSKKKLNSFNQLKPKGPISIYTVSKDRISSKLLGNSTILSMDLSQEQVSFRGITKFNDSIPQILGYISNTNAKDNKLPFIVPTKSRRFISYTFDDLSKVKENHQSLNSLNKIDSINNFQELITEIGVFDLENSQAFALKSLDADIILESINYSLKETFRQIEINEIDSNQQLKHLFDPLIDFEEAPYCFKLDDFIVFTKSLENAENIISSYTNKLTYGNSDTFETVFEQLSNQSSVLYFSIASELDSVLSNNLPEKLAKGGINKKFKKNHSQIIQLINDNGFAHVNILIQPIRKKAASNSVTEEFNITLDNDLLSDPQIVKNHTTGQKEIAVQDINNNLYLISNRGKILWKKKINGNILGKIEQIDIYKNGRLQLVFATPNQIYVLDRNGKHVSPFPMKFSDEITQPLSVFDYDKKRDYRFLVVQGKNTLMYNTKGKRVKGFNFKSANSLIKTQPKHFRVDSKDYIVFGAGKKMYILNRRGQTRVAARESINFSDNDIYLYRGHFTTTNAKGQLVQVDQRGSVSKQNLMPSGEHHFSATSKTLAALTDNQLTIRTKTKELDFGDYTAPRIFYINDKIYVSVTDLQTQKTYIFDSQTKQLPNFPIYGNSSLVLDNIDKDRNLEFIVKGDSNSLILYQLN